MIGTLLTIALHDLLLWRRMPIAIASALIPPAGMAILLIILTFSVSKQPVALVNLSNGPNGNLIKQIIASDDDAYALKIVDKVTAGKLLEDQEVAAIITIPQDFDKKVLTNNASLTLTLNNIDIDFADDIRRAVDRSVAQFDAPQLGIGGELEENNTGKTSGIQQNPYRIAIREKDLRQTNVSFLQFQVLPVFVLVILSIGIIGTALLCAQDRERGTLSYLVLAPISSWIIIAGRILGGFFISIGILLPILLVSFLFGIIFPPISHIVPLLALFAATALCASGFGAFLGSLLRGTRLVTMAASILATYMFFLGGGFTTIAFLPPWLQTISDFIPARYAIDGLRQALFYPDLQGFAKDIGVLLGTALIAIIIGSLFLRQTMNKPLEHSPVKV